MLNTNNLFIFTLFKQALGRKSFGGGKAFWFRSKMAKQDLQ